MTEDQSGLGALRIDRQDDPQTSTSKRRWTVILLLAVALGGFGLWFIRGRPPAVITTPVLAPTATATTQTVLNASGYVVARREATVSSKVTGKVAEVLIEEGMRVEANQILARLDDANIQAQIKLAQAEEDAARANLAETRAQITEADKQHQRALALEAAGVASQSDLDQTIAQVDSLRARLARQELDIIVARKRLDVLSQQLDDTIIRAPFAGVAVSKNAQPGEMISPISAGGGFTRTGIGTIVDMNSLEIEVDVNESYLNRVKPHQPVEATLDAYPDWTIPSHVLAIIPTADRQKATVRVRIAFDQLDPRILPQMGVRVAFLDPDPSAQALSAAFIPRSALQTSGPTNWVWVVTDGVAQTRAVTLMPGDADPIAIQTGLQPGERVVVQTSRALRPNMKVREQQP
jgi:RND family efflux transporter MFP subunit